MSQVHVTSNASKKWVVIAIAAVAVGAAGYWFTRSTDGTEAARVTDASATPSAVESASVPTTEFSNPAPTVEQGMKAMAEQKDAAKVIEARPEMKPITGPITERPDFVSPMEWAMLQGVVQQHANPGKELVRMVNFLRFVKQTEVLDGLPKTPENTVKRQLLTTQLIEDLPNRVQGGDLELKDAQARLAEWLPESLPNEQQRQKKSEEITKRITEAWDAYKKAEAAAQAK